MVEIEVKIRIEDPRAMREKILSLGATVHRDRHREENTLYDSPEGILRKRGQALRVRISGKKRR
jgi:adenylate cyclase class IV